MSAGTIAIVEARFYEDIADELVRGALQELENHEVDVVRHAVPGVLEIPAAVALLMESDAPPDGYVALGCVIRGETTHYDIVSNESARALMDLTVNALIPLGNGIQTVENADQAWARARVAEKNKGGGAAAACMRMLALKRALGVE